MHFSLCKILSDQRYVVRHDCPTHTPYVHSLHRMMHDFLDGGEDYWLSMDDDNPPLRNPLDLIEYDCDLIGCPTPVWHNAVEGDRPWYFNAVDKKLDGYTPHEPSKGLQEVDAIGSGCFLVARRVLQKLKHDQPFMREWDSNGIAVKSGDFAFCDKVKAAGFQVWAHYDYLCEHMNELPLLEVIKAFGRMKVTSDGRSV